MNLRRLPPSMLLPDDVATRSFTVRRARGKLSREILPTDLLERLRTLVSKAKG
jgi:hypothetical protein